MQQKCELVVDRKVLLRVVVVDFSEVIETFFFL
jgi:hypothetical protein